MRYSQSEKMEIIKLVEGSDLSVRNTLQELDGLSSELRDIEKPQVTVMDFTTFLQSSIDKGVPLIEFVEIMKTRYINEVRANCDSQRETATLLEVSPMTISKYLIKEGE